MGKKGKKTRWRELPITLADKPYAGHEQQQQQQSNRHVADAKPANFAAAAGRRSQHAQHQPQPQHQQQQQQHHQQHHHQQPHQSPNRNQSAGAGQQHHHVESSTVTFNEDEYTKITTPRQDVLFKKGYLGRRKHTSIPVIAEVINENEDGVSTDTINTLDDMCSLGEYVDPSAIYILNGGDYEVYDPYTGNVTMLMGPPPAHYPVGHPMLAAMPYQPVPMQAVDWFNPANLSASDHWMPPMYPCNNRHHKKLTSDAQPICGAQNSEVSNGTQELSTDDQQGLYQSPPYGMYPGYMFSTPLYNYNGVNIQVPQSQSPPSPSISCDYSNGKRRKKKKRRKRGGVTDEYSDSSSEEQKSQSGASCDLVPDSEKTSDSGVLTNNSGGSTPVNVIPVQLSHTAPPFHMECPRPFEILHGAPILVHHHHHHPDHVAAATAFYQPIPRYTDQLPPIGYQVIPEEQTTEVAAGAADADADADDHLQPDVEPVASYSAENSDSGISSPNSEVMVKSSVNNERDKPQQATNGGTTGGALQTTIKKNRNKKSKQRDASTVDSATAKNKCKEAPPKNRHHEGGGGGGGGGSGGGKKSSKIAKEPAIIKKLNAKKAARGKPEPEKSETIRPVLEQQQQQQQQQKQQQQQREDNDSGECEISGEPSQTERVSDEMSQLSINPDTEWPQDEELFCSLECTPGSTTDTVQFQFTKTQSMDSCESVEEETFATAVNTGGNSDTENEVARLQDDVPEKTAVDHPSVASPAGQELSVTTAGPITEAVTKWLNDQGGLMLATPCLDDGDDGDEDDDDDDGLSTDDCDSEYDDFEEHTNVTNNSPKNVQSNPYPALSRSEGSRVAGAANSASTSTPSPHDQRQNGLISSGICCLTQ